MSIFRTRTAVRTAYVFERGEDWFVKNKKKRKKSDNFFPFFSYSSLKMTETSDWIADRRPAVVITVIYSADTRRSGGPVAAAATPYNPFWNCWRANANVKCSHDISLKSRFGEIKKITFWRYGPIDLPEKADKTSAANVQVVGEFRFDLYCYRDDGTR